jgi:hypothetical protein
MANKVRVRVQVDYISKEVRLVFAEPVSQVGMDLDMAENLIKILEDKVRDLKGKLIFPMTH